jgi:hypothetical protein
MSCPGAASDGSQYHALSDYFARDDDVNHVKDQFENAGCLNSKLLVKAKYGKQIWNDHRTGANDSGSVWAVNPTDSVGPVDVDGPQLFKAFSNYDGPNGQDVPDVWLPDFTKIVLAEPLFMDEISAEIP